jgi:hypothetical protein
MPQQADPHRSQKGHLRANQAVDLPGSRPRCPRAYRPECQQRSLPLLQLASLSAARVHSRRRAQRGNHLDGPVRNQPANLLVDQLPSQVAP